MTMEGFETSDTINTKFSSEFREEKRELWGKIILLSSAILGFSVTMLSKDYLASICSNYLKISWVLLLLNILVGLYLLKKESDFESGQMIANAARKYDEIEINIPVKTDEDKNKFLALLYLHGLRITPPEENPYSQKAKDIFENTKSALSSWQMIKNPDDFYSYSHLNLVNQITYIFYGSFSFALLCLILSVISIY